jgi:glycosyltransferase involved in cell wall biosynthesis
MTQLGTPGHEVTESPQVGEVDRSRERTTKTVSIVIPALNEQDGIGAVLGEIPTEGIAALGYGSEVIVVDNGSTDRTRNEAEARGACVVYEPRRGYGNAYRAGFAAATGDVIATGDADLTYPFDVIPEAIRRIETDQVDFINTNRLQALEPGSMRVSHRIGNWALTRLARGLFDLPFEDSQSGMWIFRRSILPWLDLQSAGWTFSQELKIQAFARGFRCDEIPIRFRGRTGATKLRSVQVGVIDVLHQVGMRMSQST